MFHQSLKIVTSDKYLNRSAPFLTLKATVSGVVNEELGKTGLLHLAALRAGQAKTGLAPRVLQSSEVKLFVFNCLTFNAGHKKLFGPLGSIS